jgi:hypothetical protein
VTRLSRVSKNPIVPAKVKLAFEIISNDAKATLEIAAAGAGLTTHRLRRLLKLPQVRAWIAEERRAQLDAICASNPESLKRIRDTSENDMAAVGAIKTLEAMRVDVVQETDGKPGASRPGLQIVIHTLGGESRVVCGPAERPLLVVPPPAAPREGNRLRRRRVGLAGFTDPWRDRGPFAATPADRRRGRTIAGAGAINDRQLE